MVILNRAESLVASAAFLGLKRCSQAEIENYELRVSFLWRVKQGSHKCLFLGFIENFDDHRIFKENRESEFLNRFFLMGESVEKIR